MFEDADDKFFGRVLANENHVLQQYLPDRPSSQYNTRTRTHNKTLTTKTTHLNNRDFLIGMLYKDCYTDSLNIFNISYFKLVYVCRHDEFLEEIFEGRMKGRPTRGRKRIQLLDDLLDGKDYASQKREAEDRSMWRIRQ